METAVIFFLLIISFIIFFVFEGAPSNKKYARAYKKIKKNKIALEREQIKKEKFLPRKEVEMINGIFFEVFIYPKNSLKKLIPSQEGKEIFFFEFDLPHGTPWDGALEEFPFEEWRISKINDDLFVVDVVRNRGFGQRISWQKRVFCKSEEESKVALLHLTKNPPDGLIEKLSLAR